MRVKIKCICGVVPKRNWEVLEGFAPKCFDGLGLLCGLEEGMALEVKNDRFDGVQVYTTPSWDPGRSYISLWEMGRSLIKFPKVQGSSNVYFCFIHLIIWVFHFHILLVLAALPILKTLREEVGFQQGFFLPASFSEERGTLLPWHPGSPLKEFRPKRPEPLDAPHCAE